MHRFFSKKKKRDRECSTRVSTPQMSLICALNFLYLVICYNNLFFKSTEPANAILLTSLIVLTSAATNISLPH